MNHCSTANNLPAEHKLQSSLKSAGSGGRVFLGLGFAAEAAGLTSGFSETFDFGDKSIF